MSHGSRAMRDGLGRSVAGVVPGRIARFALRKMARLDLHHLSRKGSAYMARRFLYALFRDEPSPNGGQARGSSTMTSALPSAVCSRATNSNCRPSCQYQSGRVESPRIWIVSARVHATSEGLPTASGPLRASSAPSRPGVGSLCRWRLSAQHGAATRRVWTGALRRVGLRPWWHWPWASRAVQWRHMRLPPLPRRL
jgi:hypothetical protein